MEHKKSSDLNCPPTEDIQIKLIKSYEYNKNNFNKRLTVSLLSNNTLKFSIIDIKKDTPFDFKYESIFSLDDLIKINEYFDQGRFKKNFQNIYNILVEKYFDKNLYEIENGKENLFLIININQDNEIIKIRLTLNKIIINKDELINELLKQVIILTEESSEFKNEIKLLNDKLNNIKKRLDKIDLNSSILNNALDFEKFYSFLKFNEKIDNIKLIYKATRDGDNYISVMNKINNKDNLIFLFLTRKKRIFGAYIKTKIENLNLNGERKYYTDEKAFVFSFDNNKIYKILIPEYAIGFDNDFVILIGNSGSGNGFFLSDSFLSNKGVKDQNLINPTKIFNFSSYYGELTGENVNWVKLNEVEIFQIKFNN